MANIVSNRVEFRIVPNKRPQLQYLQEFAPRRIQHQPKSVYEGEIEEYNFTELIDKEPKYFGTTYEVRLAKDIDGNPIDDDINLTAYIPDESEPIVRFDASKARLPDNDSYCEVCFQIIVVSPNETSRYPSTWTWLTIKKRNIR